MLATLDASADLARLAVLVVWVPMLPSDSEPAANVADADLLVDAPRFWDGDRIAARAVATTIGAAGETAWDMYLFFGAAVIWEDGVPIPLTWVHQLPASWADPAKMACGPHLLPALSAAAAECVEKWGRAFDR